MEIKEAIYHRIDKDKGERGEDSTVIDDSKVTMPANDVLIDASEKILNAYANSLNTYGTLADNPERYQFPIYLKSYIDGQKDFIAFTLSATKMIAAKMSDKLFATGGYVVFIRYENFGCDWLLIVVLKMKAGVGVDDITRQFKSSFVLDMDHLHEAARLDLTKWQGSVEPYLSFIKKKKAGEDISEYFREALGCTNFTDSKHNTELVVKAITNYVETRGYDLDKKNDIKRKMYDYCEEKKKAKQDINMVSLSAILNDQEPTDFLDYIRDAQIEVNETFMPHVRTYKRLMRVDSRFGSIKVSFDHDDVVERRVQYIEDSNSLLISGVPANIVEEIHEILN
jgi:nucleoid-associated protein